MEQEREPEVISFRSNLNFEELAERLLSDLPFDMQMALNESEN